MENYLTLKSCAYLFHWSNSSVYFGPKSKFEEKRRINGLLKAFYNSDQKESAAIPYTLSNTGRPVIVLDGQKIIVSDMMISRIYGEFSEVKSAIINNIRFKDVAEAPVKWRLDRYSEEWTVWSEKYASLWLENHCKGLEFYRVHFNVQYGTRFIISGQGSNTIYIVNDNDISGAALSVDEFLGLCFEGSDAAKKELKKVLDLIA